MIQRRRRKLFTVSGRPFKSPYSTPAAKATVTNKSVSGGRVGGRARRRPDKYTELEKMRERMKLSTEEIATAMKSRKGNHTNTYSELANRVDQDVKWGKRDSQFGYVPPPPSDTSGKPHTYHEEKIIGSRDSDEHGQSRIVHRARITTGRPTTRSIWNVVKANGLSRYVIFDTKFRVGLDEYDMPPVQKDQIAGFNQRTFTVLPASTYITMKDLLDITQSETETEPRGRSQRRYASILDATSEMMFHNQNRFHRTKVKIHLVKAMKEADITGIRQIQEDIAENVLNADATLQQSCTVPIVYQFSDPEITASAEEPKVSGSLMTTVNMSLKGNGLMESDFFRDHYQIAKTTSHTLLAGETLLYRHTHCFGPGFDMANVCDTPPENDYRFYEPMSYFYILEHYGGDIVEGNYRYEAGKFASYLGTNPAYLACEFRKSIRYANQESITSDIEANNVDTRAPHMRVWDSEPQKYGVTTEKEFNLDNAQLVQNNNPGLGQMVISTMSDMTNSPNLSGSFPNN